MNELLTYFNYSTHIVGNTYQRSVSWISVFHNYLSGKGCIGAPPVHLQINFKTPTEAHDYIIANPEIVTAFVNKEINRRRGEYSFWNTVTVDDNLVKIPKTPLNNEVANNPNQPQELSATEATQLMLHFFELFDQLCTAEKALLLYPRTIAESWQRILPATANHFQIAQLLSRIHHTDAQLAAYKYGITLDPNNNERVEFFKEVYWNPFGFGEHLLTVAQRATFVPWVTLFAKWFDAGDFNALIGSMIRSSYGDSIFETWWAFIRLHFAEILLTDYNIAININYYDKIVELALEELDVLQEDEMIYWNCQQHWITMVDSLQLIVFEHGYASAYRERVERYIWLREEGKKVSK